MKAILIAIASLILAAMLSTSVNVPSVAVDAQSPPDTQAGLQVQIPRPKAETPVEAPQTEPEPQLTWQDNPNNCEPTRIRADNLECLPDAPQEQVVSVARSDATPVTGNWVAQCHAWASQAGIAIPEAGIELIDRESDCDPCVVNGGVPWVIRDCGYNGEKAYGIPQALPSYKTGCGSDPVCQVVWMHDYVFERYGGWEQALAHSYANNWY